jgi:membrane-bound lytic murein transglycosylase B
MTAVTKWASLTQDPEVRKYGIPSSVLLALIQTETDGNPGSVSTTGARGLTQFMPATARQYQVDTRPGHERSQVLGAARYLRDLGYARDPAKALASYNAGPGNPAAGAGYASTVISRAKQYTSFDRTGSKAAPAAGATTAKAPAASGSGTASTDHHSQLLEWTLTATLVLAGALLAYRGLRLMTGDTLPSLGGVATTVATRGAAAKVAA